MSILMRSKQDCMRYSIHPISPMSSDYLVIECCELHAGTYGNCRVTIATFLPNQRHWTMCCFPQCSKICRQSGNLQFHSFGICRKLLCSVKGNLTAIHYPHVPPLSLSRVMKRII